MDTNITQQQYTAKLKQEEIVETILRLMEQVGMRSSDLFEYLKSRQHQQTNSGTVPASWTRARGMLKGRGIDPIAFQRQIRAEWD